jgi:Flp pilus assembly pilin Flp
MSLIVNFLKDESGVTAAEYALVLSLIALVVVARSPSLSAAISAKLSTAAATLKPAA